MTGRTQHGEGVLKVDMATDSKTETKSNMNLNSNSNSNANSSLNSNLNSNSGSNGTMNNNSNNNNNNNNGNNTDNNNNENSSLANILNESMTDGKFTNFNAFLDGINNNNNNGNGIYNFHDVQARIEWQQDFEISDEIFQEIEEIIDESFPKYDEIIGKFSSTVKEALLFTNFEQIVINNEDQASSSSEGNRNGDDNDNDDEDQEDDDIDCDFENDLDKYNETRKGKIKNNGLNNISNRKSRKNRKRKARNAGVDLLSGAPQLKSARIAPGTRNRNNNNNNNKHRSPQQQPHENENKTIQQNQQLQEQLREREQQRKREQELEKQRQQQLQQQLQGVAQNHQQTQEQAHAQQVQQEQNSQQAQQVQQVQQQHNAQEQIEEQQRRQEFEKEMERKQLLNDVILEMFDKNRIIEINENENNKDLLIIYLPSDENYQNLVIKRDSSKLKEIVEGVKEWEKLHDTPLEWESFGIKSRKNIQEQMKKMGQTNIGSSIFNEINNNTIARCDIGRTRIEILLRKIWQFDENWHQTMAKELNDYSSVFIDDICSFSIYKRLPKNRSKQREESKVDNNNNNNNNSNNEKKKFIRSNKSIMVNNLPPEVTTNGDGMLYQEGRIITNIKELLTFDLNEIQGNDIIKIIFKENKFKNNNKIDKKVINHRALIILTHDYDIARYENRIQVRDGYYGVSIVRSKTDIYRHYIDINKAAAMVVQCRKCYGFDHYQFNCPLFRRKKKELKQKLEKQNQTSEAIKTKLRQFKLPPVCYKCGDKNNSHLAKNCTNETKCINCHKSDHNAKQFNQCDKLKSLAFKIDGILMTKYGTDWKENMDIVINDFPIGICVSEEMPEEVKKAEEERKQKEQQEKEQRKEKIDMVIKQNKFFSEMIRVASSGDQFNESENENDEKEEHDQKAEVIGTQNGNYDPTMQLPNQQQVVNEANSNENENKDENKDNDNENHSNNNNNRDKKINKKILDKIKDDEIFKKEKEKNMILQNKYQELIKLQKKKYSVNRDGVLNRDTTVTTNTHTHTVNNNFVGDTPEINGNLNENDNKEEKKNDNDREDARVRRNSIIARERKRRSSISLFKNIRIKHGNNVIQIGSSNYDENVVGRMKRDENNNNNGNGNDGGGGDEQL